MISKSLGTSSRKFAQLRSDNPAVGLFAQALYPLIVVSSDDFGRQQADAFTVKHSVWSTAPEDENAFEAALQALHVVGLIIRYSVNGSVYLQVVDFEGHQQGLHKRTESKFPPPPEIPGDSLLREQKGREQKGTEEKGAALTRFGPLNLLSLWNAHAEAAGLRPCLELVGDRLVSARCRLKDKPAEAYWTQVIDRIAQSVFCRGQNDRGWVADIDFLLRKGTHVKVLEGKYDDRAKSKSDVPVDTSVWDQARACAAQRTGKP